MRALALLAVAACTDLPDFDDGCGNFVIDPGEDCDGDPLCDSECFLSCDTEGECPDGYTCGADDRCHAPGGQLVVQATSVGFQATSYGVTDVDLDGYGDVISLSSTSLDVHYGDAEGSLASEASTLTSRALGLPSFSFFDDPVAENAPPTLDILAPTANGIAGYTSPYGVMRPHAFTIDLNKPKACPMGRLLGEAFEIFALNDRFLGLFTRDATTGRLQFAIIDGASKDACPSQDVVDICNITLPLLDPATGPPAYGVLVDVYDDNSGTKIIAVGLPSNDPGHAHYGSCVISAKFSGTDYAISDLTPTNNNIEYRPVLVNLDNGPCPTLIDADHGAGGLGKYTPAGTPGNCTFPNSEGMLTLPTSVIPAGTPLIGRVTVQPLITGFAKEALVFSSGIYAYPTGASQLKELYRSDRPLTNVRTVDLDADGDLDAVAIGRGAADVDLLLRAATSPPTPPSYLRYRIDSGIVYGLELGDYDGNEIEDIAYLELQADGKTKLQVTFSTRDRPLDPQTMGTYGQIVGLCRIQTPDASDPNNLVDDLIALDIPPGQMTRRQPLLSLLHGSPQRSMLSYFDPRTTAALGDSVFLGVSAGNFFTDTADPPYADVIAIESASVTGNLLEVRAWPFAGDGRGALGFPAATPPEIAGLSHCTRKLAGTTGGGGTMTFGANDMCIEGAHFVTWPRASHDVVIAIENPNAAISNSDATAGVKRAIAILDPQPGPPASIAATVRRPSPAFDAVDGRLTSRSLRVGDVDDDGQNELIAAFGDADPFDATPLGGIVLVCEVSAAGEPTECKPLSSLIPELEKYVCVDAVIADVTPRTRLLGGAMYEEPPDNLIVACHAAPGNDTLFRLFPEGGQLRASRVYERTSTNGASIEKLETGDVNGDGVDDILAFEVAPAAAPNLIVIRQCTSRDAGTERCR